MALLVVTQGAARVTGSPAWLVFLPSSLLLPLVVLAALVTRRAWRAGLSLSLFALFVLLGPLMAYHRNARLSQADPAARRLRIVSLNAASWEVELAEVGRRTAELHPDILLMQEMWWLSHLKSFKVGLPQFLFRGDGTGHRGTNIGSRFAMEPWRRPPPERTLGSIVSIEGRDILLLTVHGRKASSGLAEPAKSLRLQQEQARELLEYIRDIGLPVILGGDFNGPTGAPLYSALSQELVDSFLLAGKGYGYTFPSTLPLDRIDFLFVSPELGRVASYRAVDVGSDHLAIVVELEFRPDCGNKFFHNSTRPVLSRSREL